MSNFLELDPNLIWQNDKQTKNVRGITALTPWTSRQEIPGFDYKTSYQVALPYVFKHFNRFIETPDIVNMREVEGYKGYEELQNHYKTITGTSYPLNFGKTEPGEFNSFLNNFEILNNFKTKDMKLQPDVTEYGNTYKWHIFDANILGEYKDHTNEVLCKSPSIFKEIQPSFAAGGILKERDIYRSQTHYTHHYISPEKVMEANETLGGQGVNKVYSDPNPIDPHLRLPFRQVTFPKRNIPVPHRGMISESKEKFKKQIDFFAPADTVDEVEKFEFKASSKEDVITEMNKNYTYYDHIGHNWRTMYN